MTGGRTAVEDPPLPAGAGTPAALHDVHAPLSRVRDAVAATQSRLDAGFRRGEPVSALVRARSRFVDRVLALAWRRFGLDDDPRRALVAVGGYGRGELHPRSDIDLLVLVHRAARGAESEKVRRLVAFLWDVGLAVGSSVRSVRECVDEARRDVTVATNLMEGRLVCGSAGLLARMHERTGPARVWSSRRFFEAKMREQRARHRKFDDTGHNLEPNVKEGPGGLRDIQTIAWVAKRHFGTGAAPAGVPPRTAKRGREGDAGAGTPTVGDASRTAARTAKRGRGDDDGVAGETGARRGARPGPGEGGGLDELVRHGFLTGEELAALESGREFLWRVRFALHLLTGRAEDRLRFDHQRRLARMLGFEDEGARLGVERLMKRYYREVMELSRLNEMLLEHFGEAILHPRRRDRVKPLNRRFQAVNGYVEAIRDDVFRRQPLALLEVFLLLQQHPELEGVRASTIRLIRASRHRIDDRFRSDVRARSLFRDILRQPRGINHELRRMHRYGILGAYLPVFDQVAGQMQYDLFHVYTVDEHSLFVVRNLRRFADPARRHEFPRCADIFARLPRPELIYVAGLFHDVAKGRDGDHSELGADLVREFCTTHGFGEHDTGVVAWLVRHHLLMSVTAQRRDISDPRVVSEFAATVGDHVHLDYLYLLTIADIRATNPGLWNDWKDALLHDLYRSTVRALLRGPENPIERAELARETRAEAGRRVADAGGDPGRAAALWDHFGDDYLLRHSADEVLWHTAGILDAAGGDDGPLVLVRDGRGGIEVFVYTPDRDFLFAVSASILGRLGLTVLDSRIITGGHGMTLDSWVVEDVTGAAANRARHEEIRTALRTGLRKPAEVPRTVRRLARRQLRHFTIPVEVNFTHDASNLHTVMEVIAADRPWLLARIGWALADAGVRIHRAKIATFGERAEDVFYLTDTRNRRLSDARIDEVDRGVRAALAS